MNFDAIKALLEPQFGSEILAEDLVSSPHAIIIGKNAVKEICAFCRDHDQLYFDMLSCLTGIDNGPQAESMELVYNLYSIPYDHHLMLRTEVERRKPVVHSVSSVWKTAEWHEREVFDLLGIKFKEHPDMRRILLPDDWIGHPLRKDYKEQKEYHGVTVVYDRDKDD